jgi:glycosyltransferase involved in cell wall biosynthesis
MTISVFTPSHNPKWLDEVADSLIAQTHDDWEWVVLLNGEAEWEPPHDPRITVLHADPNVKGVGALKKYAVEMCKGDIILELDHDDLLMPTALKRVAETFEDNPDVGFVYSDFAQINEDGSPNFTQFDLSYGWSYRDEGEYHITNSKSPHPHNVSLIWFAPNHLRSWRRSAYDTAGGYNPALDILDDQDLMCRTYLVTSFHHIKENLYLQRIHNEQTQAQAETNRRIQAETIDMYNHYISSLVVKWSKDNDLFALDLGGAHNPAWGYQTVDLHEPADHVGDVFDIFDSLPDNSVGVLRAADFLEHLDPERKVEFWNEAHRVLANGGMFLSLTPSALGTGAYSDPTHRSYYVEQSFYYWTNQNFRKYVPEITARFQVSRLQTFFPSEWHQQQNISYVQANLIALKNDSERFGGILSI